MLAVIATFEVQPGKEQEFEAEARALGEKVRANEPDVKLYQLTRAKRSPQTYRMLELYADKDAFKAHGATDYFPAAFERMKALLAGDPVIELLDGVD
ncbi:MAG: antibiotic biosynthesis monooxygenase [Novosphingobium sp.]|nr:antibiotic biosynthesis monooxygenase [Novosphingobium sp.]